jgi:parallel beta-helix repeat protein
MHGYNTIRNVATTRHMYGFSLSYAYDSTIENCSSSDSAYGFYLFESRRNTLLDSESLNNGYGIVLSTLSDDNAITGNLIEGNDLGIDMPGAFDNTLTGNTIRDSATVGIAIRLQPYGSSAILHANRNRIYHNDFIRNPVQASVYETGTENAFFLDAPVGGNYWSDHLSTDADLDGFADTPYAFVNGSDELPLMEAFGWHPESLLDELVAETDRILGEIDDSAAGGTLAGNGDPDKLAAFRDKIEEVKAKLAIGHIGPAYHMLEAALAFADGEGKPKDLVVGVSAAGIAESISDLIGSILLYPD